jgi:hypothetical protein
MNARWPKAILILACLLAVAVIARLALRTPEPVSRGRPLSYWVNEWAGPYRPEAQAVLREIGPAAIPFLLHNVRRNEPLLERANRDIRPKLPDLVRRLLPEPYPSSREKASQALAELGQDALPRLCELATGPDPALEYAIRSIASRAGSNDFPAIIRLLEETNAQVRAEAAVAISMLPSSSRSGGKSLVQTLTRRLNDSYPVARQEVAVALWQITHDTNMIGLLINELKNAPDQQAGSRILFCDLQLMGPAIKPALPVISDILATSPQLGSLSNSMRRLGPGVFD